MDFGSLAPHGRHPFLDMVIIGMAAVQNSQNRISGGSIGFLVDAEVQVLVLKLLLIRFQHSFQLAGMCVFSKTVQGYPFGIGLIINTQIKLMDEPVDIFLEAVIVGDGDVANGFEPDDFSFFNTVACCGSGDVAANTSTDRRERRTRR